jgi:predicted transcriptional regulator YdeE
MEPRILELEGFRVLGLARRLPAEEQTEEVFGVIWSGFESRIGEIRVHATDGAFFGLSFPGDLPGEVEYVAAMAVSPTIASPEGMVIREVPAARYAVFDCPVTSIGETYRFVFEAWLPNSGYHLNAVVPVFERYPPEEQGSSSVQIHVPITEAV